MICENCKCEHEGSYGSGRFCSDKCARGFSTKAKRAKINEKVSLSLTGRTGWEDKGKERVCLNCCTLFIPKKKKQIMCSQLCARQYKSPEARISISESAKQRAKEGKHNGFPSRLNKEPSWAEKVVMEIFNKEGIQYQRDFKINRFFGDFVFVEKKLVLEIDGKQHKELKRLEKDKERDKILNKEGYRVVRIDWIHKNYNEMKQKIQDFINLNLRGVG